MAIGLDALIPLQSNTIHGFYALSQTIKDNMRQNVKMLLLTAPGERIMFPDYGAGIRNYLFENNPEFEIVERIRKQIATYIRDISIVSLEVRKGTDREIAHTGQENLLSVKLVYLIKGVNLQDVLELTEKQLT